MGIVYVPIDGERVSRVWKVPLDDMRADGVDFIVREGKRTFERQQYFYNGWINRLPGFYVAAVPSHNAPHIRTGRLDHAIDFSNDADVFSWLSRHGLRPVRTVRGESWHIECPAWALLAYYAKHKAQLTVSGAGKVRTKAANLLLRRRRLRKAEGVTGRGPRWRRLNRAVRRSEAQVRRHRNRAKSSRVKRILNRVLRDRDGRL